MGGGSPHKLFDIPVDLITPIPSHLLYKEPSLPHHSVKTTVPNLTATTLANTLLLAPFENTHSGHVGIDQRGIFGYSYPDVSIIDKSGAFTEAFSLSKQPLVDSTPFGSPNDVSSVPICFSATPKPTSSPSSRRNKKPHNLPHNRLGLLPLSPSKSPLLGHPPKTNKRKNLFSGTYAFSGKQARGEEGSPNLGKLCIENIEKESGALEALPILVGDGASTNEISALPMDQERRMP